MVGDGGGLFRGWMGWIGATTLGVLWKWQSLRAAVPAAAKPAR